jgi:hypothetical protein
VVEEASIDYPQLALSETGDKLAKFIWIEVESVLLLPLGRLLLVSSLHSTRDTLKPGCSRGRFRARPHVHTPTSSGTDIQAHIFKRVSKCQHIRGSMMYTCMHVRAVPPCLLWLCGVS